MSDPAPSIALILQLLVLSLISFGGIPAMLPDLRAFVVTANGWLTDREFANCFALVQVLPGPNMILMMSFIGWKVGGLSTAIAGGLAILAPSSIACFIVFRLWERFRHTAWQSAVRRGLAPVTIGLVVAGGYVIAFAGDVGWVSGAVTVTAAGALLLTRVNPLWLLAAGGVLGGVGLL